MDSLTLQRLSLAWMRRKRWENRALAGEIVSLLGQAMGGKAQKNQAGSQRGRQQKSANWVSGGEMLAMMGVKL